MKGTKTQKAEALKVMNLAMAREKTRSPADEAKRQAVATMQWSTFRIRQKTEDWGPEDAQTPLVNVTGKVKERKRRANDTTKQSMTKTSQPAHQHSGGSDLGSNLLSVPDELRDSIRIEDALGGKDLSPDRTITISHGSRSSTSGVASEEFDTGVYAFASSAGGPIMPLSTRVNVNLITKDKVAEILSDLPFYKVLTPAFRNYIAEQMIVESYLAIETVPCGNPLT